jgi:hypothetical protein
MQVNHPPLDQLVEDVVVGSTTKPSGHIQMPQDHHTLVPQLLVETLISEPFVPIYILRKMGPINNLCTP